MRQLILVLLALMLIPAWAQEEPQSFKLDLHEVDGMEFSKAAMVNGETSEAGDHFYLDNLNVMQPISVYIMNKDGSDDIGLELSKFHWGQPLRTTQTNDGFAQETLRTEGELRIRVVAKGAPTPYQLVVQVGDPVEPPMEPVIVSMAEFKDDDDEEGGFPLALILAGVIGALVAVIVVLVMRKSS